MAFIKKNEEIRTETYLVSDIINIFNCLEKANKNNLDVLIQVALAFGIEYEEDFTVVIVREENRLKNILGVRYDQHA